MIEGFQHVGIGVTNMARAAKFYKRILGFSMKLNDHEEEMQQMADIIGSVERMHVIMSLNLCGGGAIELVQHTGSIPRPMPSGAKWGDLGYLACGVKAYHLDRLVEQMRFKGARFITPVITTEVDKGGTWRSVWLRDPDGLAIELLETAELKAAGGKPRVGGFSHVTVGVADMDASIDFYSRLLGFNVVMQDSGRTPKGLEQVTGGTRCRTVVLKRSRLPRAALPIEGGMVRLVQARGITPEPLYDGRRWGDVGIMEMALDVNELQQTYDGLVEGGAQPFCPPTRIDMGSGSVGSFAYVKDPDGNIVEMVEVEKLAFLPPPAVAPFLNAILKVRNRF